MRPEPPDLARELLAELDRLKVAYSTGLASDVEPPSMELLARARRTLDCSHDHESNVDIQLSELLSCPFCGSQPNEFEDGEIQCGSKLCPARPSIRWAGRGAWNTRFSDE